MAGWREVRVRRFQTLLDPLVKLSLSLQFLEVIRSSNQTLIEEDQRGICPAWDGVYEDMME